MRRFRIGGAASVPVALVLSLSLAGQAMATTWATPVPLARGAWASGLVAVGQSTAVALYEKCVDIDGGFCINRVLLKRSLDGGKTWGGRLLLARDGDMSAIAGRGANVDVVWRGKGGGTRYARSANGGQTFGRSKLISSSDGTSRYPSIARGPGHLVVAAWGEWPDLTDKISVRVSKDGGATFGGTTSWPTSEVDYSAVAAGQGVVYVAYLGSGGALLLRRSLDAGATWSSAVKLSDRANSISITAAGSDAYVAYADNGRVRYRRTTDRGSTWSSARDLSPASWASGAPRIALDGGVIRATFSRWSEASNSCPYDVSRLFYRQSIDGVSWTAPERVSPRNVCSAWGAGIAFSAGKVLALYDDEETVYVRRGTP